MTLHMGKASQGHRTLILKTHPLHPKARTSQIAVGVLPFLDLRPGKSEAPLAEGMAEEVLQFLNQVEGLRAISRTTSFLYAGSSLPLVEVGRRLQADAILGGSLLEQDGRFTLKAELVDVAADRAIWSTALTFDRRDLFSALEDIARSAVSALRRPATFRPRRATDPEAYDHYLKGRHYYFRFNRHSMGFAAQMFRRALDLDPGYASAWAGLADCAAYSYIYVERSETQRELAESCSRKALELDPDLAEAHASRGLALSADGQAEEAEEAFETALRLDPNLYEAAYFYARHCFAAGKPERAVEYFEWAAALRPEDFQAILLVAQVYHSLGVEDEAERARRQGLALVEQRLERFPDDVRARYLGANALVALGEREKGLAWAKMARDLDPDDPMLLYNLGCIHALAQDPQEALDCLERAVTAGLTQKNWFLHDGDLDAVRSHPRFQQLMEDLAD